MMFRLLFCTQDDCYESESASYVIDAIAGLDEESCKATLRLAVMGVEVSLN